MIEEIIEFVYELNPSCSLLLTILDGFFLFGNPPERGEEYYDNETPFIFLNILTHPQTQFLWNFYEISEDINYGKLICFFF